MAPRVVLTTDPGPDPDDAKVILVLAVAHLKCTIRLACVVCNGGAQARERATLARCLLDHVGAYDVPVGVGSAGVPSGARPHEYALPGYADVDQSRLLDGAQLLHSALRGAQRKSVRLLCISSLRDVADLLVRDRELVLSRVERMVIQGGLLRDEANGAWVGDSAVNNGFDQDAANVVYGACQQYRLPMTVVSRFAVPLLPMQLANSFALRTECPVMRYLADAQSLGLVALWSKLCAGQLPPRCTRQWYFETFCGVDASEFERLGFDQLDAREDITFHLNGYVKPYDVIAAMGVLDETAPLLRKAALRSSDPRMHEGSLTLLLEPSQAINIVHVIDLLRDTYHIVVERTSRSASQHAANSSVITRGLREGAAQMASSPAIVSRGQSLARRIPRVSPLGARGSGAAATVDSPTVGVQGVASRMSLAHSEEEQSLRSALRATRDAQLAKSNGERAHLGGDSHGSGGSGGPSHSVRPSGADEDDWSELHSAIGPAAPAGGSQRVSRAEGSSARWGGRSNSLSSSESARPDAERELHAVGEADAAGEEGDAVAEALIRLLTLSERRVFAQQRMLSTMSLGWCVCALLSLLTYFALSGRVAHYNDDGRRWATLLAFFLCTEASIIVALLFIPAIEAHLGRIRTFYAASLLSCAVVTIFSAVYKTSLVTGVLRDGALSVWVVAFGARATTANVVFIGALLAVGLVLLVGSVAHAVLHWQSAEKLMECAWRWWAFFTITVALVQAPVGILMQLHGIYTRRWHIAIHLIHALTLCVGAFAASKWVRKRVQARLFSALASRASYWCSLAALSGLGGLSGGRKPRALVAEATRSFGAHAQPLPAQEYSSELLCALIRRGDKFAIKSKLFATSRLTRASGKSTGVRIPTTRSGPSTNPSGMSATMHACADAYLLHAPARDEAGARCLAETLRLWVIGFEQAHGRPPVVYADSLSQDVSLEPLEHLQHTPVYLARCERLVILLTREIFDDPRRVGVCTAWAALGRGPAEVDVEVAECDALAVSAAVGAVDAFKLPATAADCEKRECAAVRATRFALELTGEALVRSTVYALLPLCTEAARRARTRVRPAVKSVSSFGAQSLA